MLKKRSGAMSTFTSSTLTSSCVSPHDSEAKRSLKESVSSIVMLGDGYFLTAAVADRNIKMWKLTNDEKSDGSATSITFIRNFSGCATGITCLTKVDKKGRFLSGSKSGTVMLWDSRFNCDDPKEGEGDYQQLGENRVLLAAFEKLERRRVDTIAMIEDGSYVRPTDDVDLSMMAAMTKKAVKEGSASVQRAARERQIIACSLQFASITGAHRTVKIWSVKRIDEKDKEKEEGSPGGQNVAEITLLQQLEHDNVIESVATVLGKSMLLAGDRMGSVTLWKGVKKIFKRGSPKIWQCIRVFNWRHKLELHKVQESMQFGITSLSFLGEGFFVSGARGGDLRIWNLNGSGAKDETVNKELIGLSGAHTSEITAIVTGRNVKEGFSKEKMMTFNTCGKDGMVLSFVVPAEKPIPRCFNVVDLGIADRYTSDGDSTSALALGCYEEEQITKLIVGSSCGNINILQQPYPSLGPQDALLAYRQQIKEECLTLQVIAENACRAIKCTDRKNHMHTYADCFTGSDLVSYLVDEKHAATRSDAVTLGHALQKHLSLFCHVSKECELLYDDIRSFYHFSEEFKKMKGATLRKLPTL
jgi:WD40 repeat protein